MENALHAMPGTGRLTVVSRQSSVLGREPSVDSARSSSDGRRSIVVEVTDTGVGMDQEALNKIFEPYFSTKATGTGLGLTIAKRNIELNGGTIAVTSQRGTGTTVTMTLPVEKYEV
jgi:signal transduction histidine kinase